MEITEIISELEIYTDEFPRQALERAIEEKEAITPLLLETINKYKNNLEELDENPDYILHMYAMYLLAQFRETKAYPIIIEFFSKSGNLILDVTVDIVTEDLHRILASVYDGNLDLIKKLIENTEVNQFVRSAGLNSLIVLVVNDLITREEIIKYFEYLFLNQVEPENSSFWTYLVDTCISIYPLELKTYIDKVFEEDLVDLLYVNQQNVDEVLEIGLTKSLKETCKNHYYSLIKSSIKEMKKMTGFNEHSQKELFRKIDLLMNNKGFLSENSIFNELDSSHNNQKNKSKIKKKKNMQKKSRKNNRSKKKKR